MIGVKENEPLAGWRKAIVKFAARIICRIGLFLMSFLWISYKHEKIDYSEWLGPDWKSEQKNTRSPMIIANHQCWSVL